MPLLAEIQMGYAPAWVDDSIAAWTDDSITAWVDGSELTLYLSDQNFADAVFWSGLILDFESPSYAQDTEYGGMIRTNAGSITIAMSAFFGTVWPPPREITIVISYTATTAAAKVHIFSGTGFISAVEYPEAVIYNLYAVSKGGNLLETTLDYDGNTVDLPRAFGEVKYGKAIRLSDYMFPGEGILGVYPQYSGGHIQANGSLRIYDDGVDITSNLVTVRMDDDATYPGIRSIILNVLPVGEVTLSGDGVTSDIDSLFTWAITGNRLNLTANWTTYTGHRIDKYVTAQNDLLSFLSSAASANLFSFYIYYSSLTGGSGSTLTLIDNRVTSTTAMSVDIPSGALAGTEITALSPKSLARHTWDVSVPKEIDMSYQLVVEQRTATVASDYPFGDELEIDVFTDVNEQIVKRLQDILDVWHMPRISLELPMAGTFPVQGQQIDITDGRYSPDMTGTFFVRGITYDFLGKKIIIDGEGGIA